jgi:hypothetical protein
MRQAFATIAFLISASLALWFVAGWGESIWRSGISQTMYSMLHWPAVSLTIALPLFAAIFFCLGSALLGEHK